jgi:predicted transcriptional regulator
MPSDVFSALANPVRRQILESLRDGPRAVNDLASLFELGRPAVSEHLQVLRRVIWCQKSLAASGASTTWKRSRWRKSRNG